MLQERGTLAAARSSQLYQINAEITEKKIAVSGVSFTGGALGNPELNKNGCVWPPVRISEHRRKISKLQYRGKISPESRRNTSRYSNGLSTQ